MATFSKKDLSAVEQMAVEAGVIYRKTAQGAVLRADCAQSYIGWQRRMDAPISDSSALRALKALGIFDAKKGK
jgi:hypothetical protein